MKKIKKLKSGLISRNLTMARIAMTTGRRFLTSNKNLKDRISDSLTPGIKDLVHEFSMMKGSIMKSGQMLSLFLNELLPDELKKVLAQLESQSYFLDFQDIKHQIPVSWQNELKIDPSPFAAASIGQVHRVTNLENGEVYAMKIQYPGIEKAINNDIRTLRFLLNSIGVIPKTINTDFIFAEVKKMLIQEMNYDEELRLTKLYREKIGTMKNIKMVKPVEKYCNNMVLTTHYINAFELRSAEVKNLSQQEKNKIGQTLIDLYFKEVFEWGLVQTDAHFGNFLVEIDDQGIATLVLLDFGATKEVPKDVLIHYRNLVSSCANREKELFFESAKGLGYFDQKIDMDFFWEHSKILAEPYHQPTFNWEDSELSDQMYKMIPKLLTKIPDGKPLGEPMFLDRKVAGIFYILKEFKCEFSLIPIREKYFKKD